MTSRFPDDTALDALAAQVRAVPAVDGAGLAALLAEARDDPSGPATARLVEQQLGSVLGAVLARRDSGVDLMDLYQEGSIAATIAVSEYAARGGAGAGLEAYVAKVLNTFLDEVVERDAAQRLADTVLLERVKLLETAELALRRRLEREPAVLELAAALGWTVDEVEVIRAALLEARGAHDAEIVEFLDDIDASAGDGTAEG
jgi:DNA-directed RNA polymerase sigma subunit (sigma70/sigma32)